MPPRPPPKPPPPPPRPPAAASSERPAEGHRRAVHRQELRQRIERVTGRRQQGGESGEPRESREREGIAATAQLGTRGSSDSPTPALPWRGAPSGGSHARSAMRGGRCATAPTPRTANLAPPPAASRRRAGGASRPPPAIGRSPRTTSAMGAVSGTTGGNRPSNTPSFDARPTARTTRGGSAPKARRKACDSRSRLDWMAAMSARDRATMS